MACEAITQVDVPRWRELLQKHHCRIKLLYISSVRRGSVATTKTVPCEGAYSASVVAMKLGYAG